LQQLEVTFPEALKNSATHGSYPPCVAVTQFFEHYLFISGHSSLVPCFKTRVIL